MDDRLYGEGGKFLYRGKKLGICALCRGQDYTYDVGALGPSFRFCKPCIIKDGPKGLRREANKALQNTKSQVDALKQEWTAMQRRYSERFGVPLKLHKG